MTRLRGGIVFAHPLPAAAVGCAADPRQLRRHAACAQFQRRSAPAGRREREPDAAVSQPGQAQGKATLAIAAEPP